MLKEVVNELDKLRVCEFCRRYLCKQFDNSVVKGSCFDVSGVSLKDTVALSEFEAESCINCVGLVQLVNNRAFLEWIACRLKESKYQFDCFNFSFRLPLSVRIRQRYLMNRLRAVVQPSDHPLLNEGLFEFDLKLSIKQSLNMSMGQLLSVPSSSTEQFTIVLDFKNATDELALVV